MNAHDVSVCIITCNQEHYIQQCLESVLAQDRTCLREILVGDDGSDDGTGETVRAYADRYPDLIRSMRNDPRLGASGNIQRLWNLARGTYIAHLDGDDFWLQDKLRVQTEFMEHHPECAAVYANARTITPDGQEIGIFNDAGAGFHDLRSLFRNGNFLNTSSMLVRRELVRPILDIDRPFIDYRIHLLLAQQGLLAQLDRLLVGYRVHAIGAMTTISGDLVRELYWEAILSVPAHRLSRRERAHGMADYLRRVFMTSRRLGRWDLLRAWYPRILDASPSSAPVTIALALLSLARLTLFEIGARIRRSLGQEVARVLFRR